MIIQKKVSRKSAVKASNSRARVARRRVRANDEIEEEVVDLEEEGVNIAPEASDLLFEAEDVAELVAEITGEDVSVTADDDVVTFEVGENSWTVEAEGSEEILESTRKPLRNKSNVKASRKLGRRVRSRR